MLEQQSPNTLIWRPSHTTLLMRTTSQLLKNMLIAAKMTPSKSWVQSHLPLLTNLLGLLITLRTDPKSSPGPRVAMLWRFSVPFFLLCSPSISELVPDWLFDQKAPSSKSLSLHFSLILRKALVPCFVSFASLGIFYFPGHTNIKYSSEEPLHPSLLSSVCS